MELFASSGRVTQHVNRDHWADMAAQEEDLRKRRDEGLPAPEPKRRATAASMSRRLFTVDSDVRFQFQDIHEITAEDTIGAGIGELWEDIEAAVEVDSRERRHDPEQAQEGKFASEGYMDHYDIDEVIPADDDVQIQMPIGDSNSIVPGTDVQAQAEVAGTFNSTVVDPVYTAHVHAAPGMGEFGRDARLKENKFYPFDTGTQFCLAEWKNADPPISNAKFDALVDILRGGPLKHTLDDDAGSRFPYALPNAAQLNMLTDKMVAMEPGGNWKECQILEDEGKPWASPLTLWYKDTLEVAQSLFGRQDLDIHLVPEPTYDVLHSDEDGDGGGRFRLYGEPWTGTRWEEMHVSDFKVTVVRCLPIRWDVKFTVCPVTTF